MMSTDKPRAAPNPALMALVMPIVTGFLSEISKLPPAEQTRHIAKVLNAMRGPRR
jgi:hypothetical protein